MSYRTGNQNIGQHQGVCKVNELFIKLWSVSEKRVNYLSELLPIVKEVKNKVYIG